MSLSEITTPDDRQVWVRPHIGSIFNERLARVDEPATLRLMQSLIDESVHEIQRRGREQGVPFVERCRAVTVLRGLQTVFCVEALDRERPVTLFMIEGPR